MVHTPTIPFSPLFFVLLFSIILPITFLNKCEDNEEVRRKRSGGAGSSNFSSNQFHLHKASILT
jgi:hypothetical protein